MILTVCKGKKLQKKYVIILSTLHPDVSIGAYSKKRPETIKCYNQTKYGIDVIDAMVIRYSVKANSQRWSIHSFYNMLDLAGINSWVLYKKCTSAKITRINYLRELRQALTMVQQRSQLLSDDVVDSS